MEDGVDVELVTLSTRRLVDGRFETLSEPIESVDAIARSAAQNESCVVMNKQVDSPADAVAGIGDGATVMISGFGPPGQPVTLIEALLDSGVGDLTVINNNAGAGGDAIGQLFAAKRVRKVVCSFPKAIGSTIFDELYHAGEIELELVPQGTLAERIRAAGAGIGGFFTRTGFGTELAEGKEVREIDGKGYVFEQPLFADFALIKARAGDAMGNLVYRKTGRNFGPVMAPAGAITVAEVDEIVPVGALDPEVIVTPGIYVDRIVSDAVASTKSGV